MREWLRRRRERKEARAFNAGYDWAAGQLLRGEDPETYMDHFTSSYEEGEPFNKGARTAIRDGYQKGLS